ncbi:plasmid pRiA4b ORF-3-like protein [Glomus cerebriforme]|uniref:Plasmid pRiA4b ORF-3-like protein n=1 Tax=Glomus cerebriforme TaxID=658196 RepID=A0A397TJS1_9GLOM|nr:plasmid pRiA4b ORF-3-like protein [Glomus cerebriforme]
MDSTINPAFFVQKSAQDTTSSDFQIQPLTFSRSSSPFSFDASRARYNNDDYTQVFQFKIQLDGIKKPPVWRRIQVPYEYTFFQFHLAIQCCMGWSNNHLHVFHAQEGFDIGNPRLNEDFSILPQVRVQEEKTASLKDYFHSKGQKMEYEYDFGDSWVHIITYEGEFDRKVRNQYPKCLKGRGKCPPEDIGGSEEFENFKEIMSDKNHPKHKTSHDWYDGKDYNPDEFDKNTAFDDLEEINDFRDVSDYYQF